MEARQRLDEVPQPLMKMVATDFRPAQKVFPFPPQMINPMQAVNPTITGSGMNLMSAPSANIAPAIKVAPRRRR
jgi:hypothetical protein